MNQSVVAKRITVAKYLMDEFGLMVRTDAGDFLKRGEPIGSYYSEMEVLDVVDKILQKYVRALKEIQKLKGEEK